ncbi:hypothetical protein C2U68_02045 [Methylomonas koyamae]|nr:hypothetical protein C2U68_02045 [Methylomonas koyamae]
MLDEVKDCSATDKHCWRNITSIEKEYYQTRSQSGKLDSIPELGVALSGGGQRAASVGIGFLEALNRGGLLDKVDVMSTVSGGSYAAYWFYSKHYWSEKYLQQKEDNNPNWDNPLGNLFFRRYGYKTNERDYFCKDVKLANLDRNDIDKNGSVYCRFEDEQDTYNEFPFFHHLDTHGRLVTWSQDNEWLFFPELIAKGLAILPVAPISWLANGVFDMKINMNLAEFYYRKGIERDYGLYPIPGKPLKSYANADNLPVARSGGEDPKKLADLYAIMKSKHLPFWIMNTTAVYDPSMLSFKWFRDSDLFGTQHQLQQTVYEFTPAYQGSPWWSYCKERDNQSCPGFEEIKLSRQVAISGAAVDSVGTLSNLALSFLNLGLGQYVNNPRVPDNDRYLHRLLPAPLAWLHNGGYDTNAPFLYLSDGAHSDDNLGLYSLIRRGTKEIIVLDAEQESPSEYNGHYAVFSSLSKTSQHLWSEHNILIDIPELKMGLFDYLDAPVSVFQGWICNAKNVGEHCNRNDEKTQKLWYVKLSVNKKNLNTASTQQLVDKGCSNSGRPSQGYGYSCVTLNYGPDHFPTQTAGLLDIFSNKDFPHDSTGDIFFEPDQASAYISLGSDLGEQLKAIMNREPSTNHE